MKESVCIICGDKSPIISKRGRKRKKESVCERKLELMLGYLLDNEANKFVNLKTNILKLREGKAVGFCGKCELETEAILELHLELEKVQMRMIDKLEGVKKLILDVDLDKELKPGEEFLSTLKDFQAAIKENGKDSVRRRIPLVFLERLSFIRRETTTYLLLENQVKTEPEPVPSWDEGVTLDFKDSSEDSINRHNANAAEAIEDEAACNVPIQPTQIKRGRGRPKGSCKKIATRSIQKVKVKSRARRLKCKTESVSNWDSPSPDLKIEEESPISNVDRIEATEPNRTWSAASLHTTIKPGRGRPINLKPNRKVKLNRLLECETCLFQTKRPYRLEEHLRSHETDDQPFTCEECSKKFSTKQYLNFHLNLHKTKVKCEVCAEKYNALEALAHLKTHAEVVLPCSKCHKCYISSDNYFLHLKLKHECQGLTCPLCSLPMQNQKALLELMEHFHQVHNIAEELKCACQALLYQSNFLPG